MRHSPLFFPTTLLVAGTLLFGLPAHADEALEQEPIQPLEALQKSNPDKIALGQKLFNDPRLSKGDILSCASCHDVNQGGALHLEHTLPGASGKTIPLNVPSFFGSGLNFAQFWDGRAATLEEQAGGPTTNPDEMGSTWEEITGKLKQIPEYIAAFAKVYDTGPTKANVSDAIAAFERASTPVNSPFDKYLRGDKTAISEQAKQGYETFKDLGCSSCHQGQNVGGNMFQKFGIISDYFHDRGNVNEKDYGRYNVTHNEEDRYVFKVPSLRNVDLTAPYFHDGSAKTLDDAVNIMAKYQLGRTLSAEERARIVAFLKTLTGTLPAAAAPPASTPSK